MASGLKEAAGIQRNYLTALPLAPAWTAPRQKESPEDLQNLEGWVPCHGTRYHSSWCQIHRVPPSVPDCWDMSQRCLSAQRTKRRGQSDTRVLDQRWHPGDNNRTVDHWTDRPSLGSDNPRNFSFRAGACVLVAATGQHNTSAPVREAAGLCSSRGNPRDTAV